MNLESLADPSPRRQVREQQEKTRVRARRAKSYNEPRAEVTQCSGGTCEVSWKPNSQQANSKTSP